MGFAFFSQDAQGLFTSNPLQVGRVQNCKIAKLQKLCNIPGLANVDDIDTIGSCLPEVGLHVNLQVLGSEMGLRREEHLDVLRRRIEDGGESGGRHGEYSSSSFLSG